MIKDTVKALLSSTEYNRQVEVKGWVRTKRGSKEVAFVAVNDGSTIHNIQAVVTIASFSEELLKNVNTGACVCIKGKLVQSQGKGQTVEIQAESIEVYGI